jgi:hypothetical protein
MIVVVSTFEGVTEAGAKVGKSVQELVGKNYPEVRLEHWTPLTGKLGANIMLWWHKSLAAKEAFDAKLFADPRWEKIWKDAGSGPFWTSQRDDYYNVD